MEKYQKMRIAVRYRLQGAASVNPDFKVALAAFDFAETHTKGFRKGKCKVTNSPIPNFMHPMEVASYLMTLQPSLRHPAVAIAGALLHDVVEDSPEITLDEIRDRFGKDVEHTTMRLSKVIGGVKVCSLEEYFENMLDDPTAPAIKGADRVNNQGTMDGAFTPEKQLVQLDESEKYILPMVKSARRLYADQEAVFENIKLVLQNQIRLIRAMHRKG